MDTVFSGRHFQKLLAYPSLNIQVICHFFVVQILVLPFGKLVAEGKIICGELGGQAKKRPPAEYRMAVFQMGSKPPLGGLQLCQRFIPLGKPRQKPYFFTAESMYTEQDGS